MTNNMQNHDSQTEQPLKDEIQVANIKQDKRISPFWLLPIIALCIGALLFFQIIKEQGETIHITFNTGDGLVANKTQIRYQGLQIGVVKKVNFTDNLKQVEVEANIYPEAKTVLRQNTKFWLVQPSASLAGISGLDTLISGNYITLQPGDGDYQDEFIAEENGPIAQVDDGDLLIHLLADDLGSISEGASVYYKKMPVGKIYDYHFTQDQSQVEIQVIIDKAYANLVKKDSRFWNISGINAQVSPSGINVKMDSLNAVVQGAIAFDSPPESAKAEQKQYYKLYANLQSAQRGIEIAINVPNQPGLKAGKTEVLYKGLQVGILSELNTEGINDSLVKGKLLVDPNISNELKSQTNIILRTPKVNLGALEKLPDMIRGEYFEILPGSGEPKRDFVVYTENEFLLQQPNALILTLTAPETYGITEGQQVYYNNIAIGQIAKQHIDVQGVEYQVAIKPEYCHLVYADSQFVAASNLDVSIGLDGIRFEAANPDKWLQGGIRLISHKNQGEPLKSYPIYKDLSYAEAGIRSGDLSPSITLNAQNLPNISKGSLVLYRQFEVGKVLEVRPVKNSFDVDIAIYPKYRHLLTDKSRFWVESAAQVDITAKGISIQASPLGRSLKGAISFDNSGSGNNKTLYVNELKAKSAGQVITLTTDNATNLTQGMSLRYLGLEVGEIESISLDKNNQKVVAKALMNPNYMGIVAKEGSQFRIISPQISAGGIENLDSLLRPYIDIDAGKGGSKTSFVLKDSNNSQTNKYNNGFPIIVEASDAANLTLGSPVYYRGVEVGKISHMDLNDLGDRVLIHLLISPKYQHLVRKNSEFWVSSGYSAEVGWSGMQITTGSVQQLLKGGISFSTPSSKIIQPQAVANQRFLLQIKKPVDAKNWNSAVLPPQEQTTETVQ
ncbi:PqiB family protein [Pasteurella bettyae]|nr:PqiB family protein [Pasteurella bettyae]SUB20904.1 mammalian cell entry-like protein [Pasteurella bettyae]